MKAANTAYSLFTGLALTIMPGLAAAQQSPPPAPAPSAAPAPAVDPAPAPNPAPAAPQGPEVAPEDVEPPGAPLDDDLPPRRPSRTIERKPRPFEDLEFPATRLVDSPTALTLRKGQIEFYDLMFVYGFHKRFNMGVGARVFLMKGGSMLMPGIEAKVGILLEKRYVPMLSLQVSGLTVALSSSKTQKNVANGNVVAGSGLMYKHGLVASGDTQFTAQLLLGKTFSWGDLHAFTGILYAPKHGAELHVGGADGLNVISGFGAHFYLQPWLGWVMEVDHSAAAAAFVGSGMFRLNLAKMVSFDIGVSYLTPSVRRWEGAGVFLPRFGWAIRSW